MPTESSGKEITGSGLDQLRHPTAPPRFQAGFDTFLSPYTYRYGSQEMKQLWSQETYWKTVRDVWIAVAEVQMEAGLVNPEQVANLKERRDLISVERIWQLESQNGHDVVSAIQEFTEVAPIGGVILHKGLTSEDVLSNAEIIIMRKSLQEVLRPKITATLESFAEQIDKNKGLVCMGFTHLQAAEPTTMGYRFSTYARNVVDNLIRLDQTLGLLKGKGIKGPVGTSGSLSELLEGTSMSVEEHERRVMAKLGIDYALVANQTYPRSFLYETESALAGIGLSLHQFSLDMQILQSSVIDEVAEPRRPRQKGSSSMPHKRNPITDESISSIAETLPGPLLSSWMTGAFVTLERTLRDSAGKRDWLPVSLLATDEILTRASKVVKGLTVNENAVARNLRTFAPYSASEVLMDRLVRAGVKRPDAYDIMYDVAQEAVEAVRNGEPNTMKELALNHPTILSLLGKEGVDQAFEDVFKRVGDVPERCDRFLKEELYPAIGKN